MASCSKFARAAKRISAEEEKTWPYWGLTSSISFATTGLAAISARSLNPFGPPRSERNHRAVPEGANPGDVIVHGFRPEVRHFYNLEKMWGGGRPGERAVS